MNRRRVLTVDLDGYRTTISGVGAWSLIHEVTGRKPFYVSRTKSFSANEDTARSVIALSESRYYDVVVTGPRAVRAAERSDVNSGVKPFTGGTSIPPVTEVAPDAEPGLF